MNTQEALGALEPLSSGEVAAFLLRRGVTGQRGHSHQCPIANYLDMETGRPVHLVTGSGVSWWNTYPQAYYHPLPLGVRQFVRQFDQGEYPFLESV